MPNRSESNGLRRKRQKVVFALDAIAHYREDFFFALKERLARESIELNLVVGSTFSGHNIGGVIPWAIKVPLYQLGPLSWLAASKETRDADLLIVAQVLKQAFIFKAVWRNITRQQRVALFGHGKLYSACRPSRISTFIKRFISKRCHWWFAYTEKSAQVVREEIGFPGDRITVVNNAINTTALISAKTKLTVDGLQIVRRELKISSENVGIYVGGMYHSKHHTKRLDFLVASCLEIRQIVPDFEMIFVGGGPAQRIVEQAAVANSWIHYVGVKKGVESVPYWAISKICLNPGLVGLGILDALALGVPLVTGNVTYHSPEIIYLKNGVNGLIIDDKGDPKEFGRAAASVMLDKQLIHKLSLSGLESAREFTNEAMVEKFSHGICAALAKSINA